MYIGYFGENKEDGRPQILLGLTPGDLVNVLHEGGQIDVNRDEDPDKPFPIRMILMARIDDEEIEKAIAEVLGDDGGAANDDDM